MRQMLFILLLFLSLNSLANRQHQIDSLASELRTAIDTNKPIILNKLSLLNRGHDNDLAIHYAKEALKISQWLEYDKGISMALSTLGNVYSRIGDYNLALSYHQRALKIRKAMGDRKMIAGSLHNIGNNYKRLGEIETAIEYYRQALKINEKIDNKSWASFNLASLGNIFMNQGNYETAQKYMRKAMALSLEMDNQSAYANQLNSIGITFKRMDKPDSALYYFEQSLKIRQALGESYSIGQNLNNIGVIYSMKGDEQTALEYYKLALGQHRNTGDKRSVAIALTNIGRILTKLGEYQEAEPYLKEGLEVSTGIGAMEQLIEAHNSMAGYYESVKSFEKAFEHMAIYAQLRDSMYKESGTKKLAEMEAKYENEKKQREIELLEEKRAGQQSELTQQQSTIHKQQIIGYGMGGIVIVLLVFGVILYRTNKQKQKAAEELALQKVQLEEKSKHITDSIVYAKRIQEAVLPPEDEIREYFPDSFIFYRPRDIVSGDFYWLGNNGTHVVLAIADCTGHGVPGAFMSMIGHDLLNQIINDGNITKPSQALRMMDHKISAHLNKKGSKREYHDGMDIAICSFDLEKNTASYSGAYRPLLQVRKKYIIEHQPNKFSIGGVQDSSCKVFYDSQVDLMEGDSLYMFSDGFADQFGGDQGKKFMNSKLRDLILDMQNKSMSEQRAALESTFDSWMGDYEQLDDILIVGLRVGASVKKPTESLS